MPRRRVTFVLGLLVVLGLGASLPADKALANVPPPEGPRPPQPQRVTRSEPVKLVVRRNARAETSRIVIPKRFLAAAEAAKPNAGETGAAPPPTRSIVAGIAISLAIAGGFLALRRGRRAVAVGVVAAGVTLGALGFWAASATADLAPPPQRDDKIVIEVVDDGDQVVLTLGRGVR